LPAVSHRDLCAAFRHGLFGLVFQRARGPVGSALVGADDTIERARKFRKIFGGGMRQAGIIAAGALYALEHHVGEISEDHSRRKLSLTLAGNPR